MSRKTVTEPFIINIHGKAEHGKDTLANYLKKELNGSVQVVHYGDDLKKIAKKKGWNGEKDNNGRVLLQFIGTEWGRKLIDKDLWVKRAEVKFENVDHIIIPDCRFPNEIDYFKNRGYKNISIKIVRLDEEGNIWNSNLNEKQKKHDSEVKLDDYEFDYTFYCKNLDDVLNSARVIVNELVIVNKLKKG